MKPILAEDGNIQEILKLDLFSLLSFVHVKVAACRRHIFVLPVLLPIEIVFASIMSLLN
jgi:hypothetical protein